MHMMTQRILTLCLGLAIVSGCLLVPQFARADGCDEIDKSQKTYDYTLPNVPRYCEPGIVVQRVLNIAFTLIGGVSLLFVVIGGLRYTTSGGNEERAAQGRKTVLYALVGLAVVLLALAIVNIVIDLVLYGKTL
jgi:type IV secretion system pilin